MTLAALIKRNLGHQRRLILASTAGLIAFELLLSWASAQLERRAGMRTILQLLPPTVQTALASQISFVSFSGAIAFGFDHPVALAISLSFIIAAATTPAWERESGFLDVVMARPVTRDTYFLACIAGVVLGAIVAPASLLIGAATGLAIARLPDQLPWTRYIPCAYGLSTLLLAAGGLSLLFAAGARRRGRAIARSIALIVACFFLDFLAEIRPELRWPALLSPFHYFRPVTSAVVPETPMLNPLALLSIFALTAAVALARFRKQDL